MLAGALAKAKKGSYSIIVNEDRLNDFLGLRKQQFDGLDVKAQRALICEV